MRVRISCATALLFEKLVAAHQLFALHVQRLSNRTDAGVSDFGHEILNLRVSKRS